MDKNRRRRRMRMRRTKKGINVELVNKSTKVLEGKSIRKVYIMLSFAMGGGGSEGRGEG